MGMGGPEYLSFLQQDSKPEYTLLMGANTYRMFAGMAESDAESFEELTARPKVVFSRAMGIPRNGPIRRWSRTTRWTLYAP
jgi:hypothetical protein